MVVDGGAGVEDVFDGVEVLDRHGVVGRGVQVVHDAAAIVWGVVGVAAEERGCVVVFVWQAEVVEDFVQEDGIIGEALVGGLF
ncbi:hypothetical protein [Streptomyces sp. NPDC020681]|uniref:hypothetical protein n=1 Tax=Streptomyces sp. NPDC020681 TaxID=3365083 RepID=UPI0037A43222